MSGGGSVHGTSAHLLFSLKGCLFCLVSLLKIEIEGGKAGAVWAGPSLGLPELGERAHFRDPSSGKLATPRDRRRGSRRHRHRHRARPRPHLLRQAQNCARALPQQGWGKLIHGSRVWGGGALAHGPGGQAETGPARPRWWSCHVRHTRRWVQVRLWIESPGRGLSIDALGGSMACHRMGDRGSRCKADRPSRGAARSACVLCRPPTVL